MADQLPINFAIPGEGSTTNYNFTDIADATVISVMYCSRNQTGAGVLSRVPVYSDTISTDTNCSAAVATKDFDVDFDATINKPLNVRGKCYVNVPLRAAGTGTTTAYIIAKLRKYSGVTETDIASGTSATMTWNGATLNHEKMMLISFDISTIAHFKKGDILRLTIEGWFAEVSGNGNVFIGHDPEGRTSTASGFPSGDYTQLTLNLPIVPDL